jgi:hypothetical protein
MGTKAVLALSALAAAVLTASCGSEEASTPRNKQKAEQITMRNAADEQLKALSPELRRIGLIRAIRQTGNRCPRRVESEVRQGEHEGMALWTARCDDNRQWAIFVGANRQVQVRNCEQMERLGLPACAPLPPAPPQREQPKSTGQTETR